MNTDIADLVVEEIKRAGFDKKLPYGIVLTGGGANLEGIADAFTHHTGIDTRIGVPEMVVDEESAEKVDGPEYATITGLLWNALQAGAYCMVDQRPVPVQPAQPAPTMPSSQPVRPTMQPTQPRVTTPRLHPPRNLRSRRRLTSAMVLSRRLLSPHLSLLPLLR